MGRENRILILAGIALVAVAALYGVYYAFFDEHQTLVGMGTALATSFVQAASGNLEQAYAAIEQYRALATEYRLEVHFHGHLGFLGIALVLLGFVVHTLQFGVATRVRLATLLAVSALLFPAGALLQAGFAAGAGSLLAVAGATGLVLGMAAFAFGALRRGTRPA